LLLLFSNAPAIIPFPLVCARGRFPTPYPSAFPSKKITKFPTAFPSRAPTKFPTTKQPSAYPTAVPCCACPSSGRRLEDIEAENVQLRRELAAAQAELAALKGEKRSLR